MSVFGTKYATIIDRARFQGADGTKLPFIRQLSQANALIHWLPMEQCNEVDHHVVNVETSSPLPSTVIQNRGVIPSFAKSSNLTETTCTLADWLEIAERVAKRGGDPESYRVEQAFSKMEAFGRKLTQLFFYGNIGVTPSDFNGLAMRFGAISGATNGDNVLDGGGRNNTNTSFWLVGFGPRAVTGIFPEGGIGGFMHRNWGLKDKETATDMSGNSNASIAVYKDEFEWQVGICVADWRHVIRVANIDVPSLNALQNDADLAYFADEAVSRLPFNTNVPPEPGVEQINPVYYWFSNRTVWRNMKHQLKSIVVQGSMKAGEGLEGSQEWMPQWHYDNKPWGICDQILDTEANIS